jgi:hypothetical protein
METIKIPIPIKHQANYEIALKQWKWFRKQLMKIYNVEHLVENFDRRDGKISENTRIEEGEAGYEWEAPEYNYNWYNQKLEFKDGLKVVKVDIEIADFGSHTKFSFENEFPDSKVVFNHSVYEQHNHLQIAKNSLYNILWEEALEDLKNLDEQNYEGI